jgi:hypothetical protein
MTCGHAASPTLHASPVLTAHLEQCPRDLPQAADANSLHQQIENITVVEDCGLQVLQHLG